MYVSMPYLNVPSCIYGSVSPPPPPVFLFLQAVVEAAGSKSGSQWGIATELHINQQGYRVNP